MTCRAFLALLFLGTALCCLAVGQQQPIMLGVLEDTPGHNAGEQHYRSVRVVFYKEGGEWKPFPSDCPDQKCLDSMPSKYPQQVNWTVSFDGRSLGQVTSHAPDVFRFYADVGQENVIGTSAIPTIGKPSAAYAGWAGDPVYRPLVANSRPYFSDPDEWKRSQAPVAIVTDVRREFRKKYPKLNDCEVWGKAKPYSDFDIRQVKSYASNRGWRLVEVAVNGCEPGDERGDPLEKQWFVSAPTGEVRYLDSNMWLVDAGDFDNDGKSEVVFAIDDYNRGGYRLFYADFKKSAVFEFSYH